MKQSRGWSGVHPRKKTRTPARLKVPESPENRGTEWSERRDILREAIGLPDSTACASLCPRECGPLPLRLIRQAGPGDTKEEGDP